VSGILAMIVSTKKIQLFMLVKGKSSVCSRLLLD
jgi:hypothetical protein